VLHAPELEIDTRRKHLRVATDGEVNSMVPPLRYRVRPGALTVIVPAARIENQADIRKGKTHAYSRTPFRPALRTGRPGTARPPARTRAPHRPDVVVVSGDLTQRAKSEQFEEARAWLDTLPGPQIIVPGNHDISLYNVFRRFVLPLDRYKRYITDDLDPSTSTTRSPCSA
jgi:3',5'-cyclic AMP phosphodiesterase CpdA